MGKNQNKKVASYQNSSKSKNKSKDSNEVLSNVDWKYYGLVAIIAAVFGVLHTQHVGNMFEKQRFFSHLSTLERELSFRTEMGLYYSYYKTIAEAPSFINGMQQIIQCNITEYPDKVNVLRRFNLYPEVVLGAMFRIYSWYGKTFNVPLQKCYNINRGQGMPQVQSCEGMGDIAHFYVFPTFWLTGFMMSSFFVLATYLSGSILGGFLTVASFFYNHGEATRVMWTPPLRESFSFPLLIVQMFSLVIVIRCKKPDWKDMALIALTTTAFMLPWQFAQFVLLTQVCAIFGLYVLKFIGNQRTLILLYGLSIAHGLNFILQFGNTLLISSFFMAAMISTIVIVQMEVALEKLPHRIIIWITQAFMFVFLSFSIKIGTAKVFQIKDDAHIFDILKSKFTDYKDFHTLLYVCAPEFDFIGMDHPIKISKTLLLPVALFVAIVLVAKVLYNEWRYWIKGEMVQDDPSEPSDCKPYAEHFYVLLQTVAFLIMAIMLMRLKLFSTPALCLMASLLASRKVFSFIKKEHHYALVFLVLGLMSIEGYSNLKHQFAYNNEYNNPDLEGLVEWVNANTKSDAVFAGSMPTMAAIKLSTGRPIVNHPHYEDAGLRERTKKVYQLYSRKPCEEVYDTLKNMSVTHLIVEHTWCTKQTRPGCSLPDVWDIEDPTNKGRTPCCSLLQNNHHPFKKRLFRNKTYLLLKL